MESTKQNPNKQSAPKQQQRPKKWADVILTQVPIQEGEIIDVDLTNKVKEYQPVPDPLGLLNVDLKAIQKKMFE